ncbi:hypothetical protein J2W48_003016 [Flavobacterium piscis]|uniref:Uncharacterized protein n=1 Tax=Flavobacterium piscis TaxID=1114874 RepID=A0ABU1YA10_9FLAO|nr:hypothetical protein [Flavobacterium piscis]
MHFPIFLERIKWLLLLCLLLLTAGCTTWKLGASGQKKYPAKRM